MVDCRFALGDPNLGRQQYLTAHIPGAFYLDLNTDLSSPVQKHGGRHPLPDPQTLAQKLTAIGVTSSYLVVAYDDARFRFCGAVVVVVALLRHDRVAVLDGGYSNWSKLAIGNQRRYPHRARGEFYAPNSSRLDCRYRGG